MKRTFTSFLLLASCYFSFSQAVFSNDGALVSTKNTALISVDGNIYLDNNGIFDNSDTIKFTKDFINNAGNAGFNPINAGYVYMIGDNQIIDGTDETHFFNLLLRNTGIKYGNLDVYVDGFLDLDSLEFNLDDNIVYVTNNDLNAVINNNGFVSSLQDGGLSRQTNTDAEYLFPVGSSIYGKIYRPIGIKTTNSNQTYRVRFADADATTEGLNRDNRDILICDINENYYHKIWQDVGNDSSDLKFYFHSAIDGNQFNEIVHWQGAPRWEKAPADTLINSTNWDILEVNNWNNYNTENFALAFGKEHFADAGPDQYIYIYDTIPIQANGGTYYTWSPAEYVSCEDCQETYFWDDSTQLMTVQVEDDDNCIDFDTVLITVDDRFDDTPFIPEGITPNADGVNDFWYIRWLRNYPDNEVIIVNRWEDVVYKAAPYKNDWYGTFNGKNLPEGTYYYILKINENGHLLNTYTGPLTIIR